MHDVRMQDLKQRYYGSYMYLMFLLSGYLLNNFFELLIMTFILLVLFFLISTGSVGAFRVLPFVQIRKG